MCTCSPVPLKSMLWLKSLRLSFKHTAWTRNRYSTSGDTGVMTASLNTHTHRHSVTYTVNIHQDFTRKVSLWCGGVLSSDASSQNTKEEWSTHTRIHFEVWPLLTEVWRMKVSSLFSSPSLDGNTFLLKSLALKIDSLYQSLPHITFITT